MLFLYLIWRPFAVQQTIFKSKIKHKTSISYQKENFTETRIAFRINEHPCAVRISHINQRRTLSLNERTIKTHLPELRFKELKEIFQRTIISTLAITIHLACTDYHTVMAHVHSVLVLKYDKFHKRVTF